MWRNQLPILYYLVPPLLLAFFVRIKCRSFRQCAAFMFFGVFVHETLHLIIGAILGARPVGMSVIPKRGQQGTMELGSVCFSNITWYNALPLAIAPLLGFPLAALVADWRTLDGWTFLWIDPLLWIALASVLTSCWPSSTDWRISLRSWPIYLGAGGYVTWRYLPVS